MWHFEQAARLDSPGRSSLGEARSVATTPLPYERNEKADRIYPMAYSADDKGDTHRRQPQTTGGPLCVTSYSRSTPTLRPDAQVKGRSNAGPLLGVVGSTCTLAEDRSHHRRNICRFRSFHFRHSGR